MRTEQLREEFDLDIRWSVFPLHPETPAEGLELTTLFGGRFDIEAAGRRLAAVAEELDLPLGKRSRTYNSRLAQELGKWAEQQGVVTVFHDAVYRAYFVDGRNIALPGELAAIAEQAGLDADAALQVVSDRSYAEAVDSDWRRAAELGVTAVPTVVYQNHALVGFRPYQAYRDLVSSADGRPPQSPITGDEHE